MAEVLGAFTRALWDADLEKCEEYLRRHPARQRQGIVPDLQIGTSLYELKGIRRSDYHSHSSCNGAQVTGVEKREMKIPIEIQKQAVDLDEKMFGVAAPAVGPWQRQLNELGGVEPKPLAASVRGELGPGFEQLLGQLAEEGANEAAKRYLIPNRVVAKGVQLRLLRQRVVMAAQKAQADGCAKKNRLHYALPGWNAAVERRDAQDELHSATHARAWAGGDFGADHGLAFDGVGRSAH
jgi:hypothetical protein